MKRSEINKAIKEFEETLSRHQFMLPPFLSFTPQEWEEKGHEYDEIRDNALGWDISDFGEGHFYEGKGLYLITLRNGNTKNAKYTKTYAEKIMMMKEGQYTPSHFHWNKMEDIINRGGGNVVFRFWNADSEEKADQTSEVKIFRDGCSYTVKPGEEVIIRPGESLTLYPYCYHEFSIQKGTGYALIGEVSMCNDDNTDNRFEEPAGRYPAIIEDEEPYRLLCNEYPAAKEN
ncbi:MAG: D-lyxose/D-mannose family sugar isomerase [Eubacteriales bacterium]|nr:D-lyxose/D-mannose family sugar isomerase [Eubacteriales bacterium]